MVKIRRCCIIHFYPLLNNNTGYRIAGNFQGSKLSRICPKIIFTELFFMNFIIQPFCTVFFIISRILFSQISINRESYWPRKFPAIRYFGLEDGNVSHHCQVLSMRVTFSDEDRNLKLMWLLLLALGIGVIAWLIS